MKRINRGYLLRRAGLVLALLFAPGVLDTREAAADYDLAWCRYDKLCFGSLEFYAAAEACFWALDSALPYKAKWRFGRAGYPPPERAFLGFKVTKLRKGIIRLVGDRIVGPPGGKYGLDAKHLYSCDWHAIDQRISALGVYQERKAPRGLHRSLRRPDCRRYDCRNPPAWKR